MKIHLKFFLGWIFLISCGISFASTPANFHHKKYFNPAPHYNVPQTYFVLTLVSYSNEKQLVFLKRAGKDIQNLTVKYDFEFCSRIWHNPKTQQYKLNISTIKSHVGCVVPKEVSEGGEWIPTSLKEQDVPTPPGWLARPEAGEES